MKKVWICGGLGGLLLWGLPLVWGAGMVPELIHYQGRLVQNGQLAQGNHIFQFQLYDEETGGHLLLTENQILPVVDGLYSTQLGSTTAPEALLAAAATNELWLELEIDGNPLSGRKRITSVAYALWAARVEGRLERVVTVGRNGDFTTIQAALAAITDNSDTRRYLVKVGPGRFSGPVMLKPFVDVEGCGPGVTTLTAYGGDDNADGWKKAATVLGSHDSELRDMTVQSLGRDPRGTTLPYACAISNPSTGGSRLTRLTIIAQQGTTGNVGLYQASSNDTPMTDLDVRVDVSTGAGIVVDHTRLDLRNSRVKADPGGGAVGTAIQASKATAGTVELLVRDCVLTGSPNVFALDGRVRMLAKSCILDGAFAKTSVSEFVFADCCNAAHQALDDRGQTGEFGEALVLGSGGRLKWRKVGYPADILWVGPGCPYSSIRDAIDAAVVHGVHENDRKLIRLSPGTFDENNLSVPNYVTIEGSGPELSIVKNSAGSTAITMAAHYATLRNLAVEMVFTNSTGQGRTGVKLGANTTGLLLERVHITTYVNDDRAVGLDLNSNTSVKVRDCQIKATGHTHGYGLFLVDSSDVYVEGGYYYGRGITGFGYGIMAGDGSATSTDFHGKGMEITGNTNPLYWSSNAGNCYLANCQVFNLLSNNFSVSGDGSDVETVHCYDKGFDPITDGTH